MRLTKISSIQSFTGDSQEHFDKEQNEQREVCDPEHETDSFVCKLNLLLSEKKLPYKIVKNKDEYFYSSRESGEILGVLTKQQLDEWMLDLKITSAEIERSLTYDDSPSTGNFLDLDV